MKEKVKTAQRNPTRLSAASTQSPTLEKGQVWKLGETFVQITDAGKRLVHYKLTKKLLQRGLRKHLASMTTVQAFLESNGAELMTQA